MNNLVQMILADTWEETVVRMLVFVFVIETIGGLSMVIGGFTSSK